MVFQVNRDVHIVPVGNLKAYFVHAAHLLRRIEQTRKGRHGRVGENLGEPAVLVDGETTLGGLRSKVTCGVATLPHNWNSVGMCHRQTCVVKAEIAVSIGFDEVNLASPQVGVGWHRHERTLHISAVGTHSCQTIGFAKCRNGHRHRQAYHIILTGFEHQVGGELSIGRIRGKRQSVTLTCNFYRLRRTTVMQLEIVKSHPVVGEAAFQFQPDGQVASVRFLNGHHIPVQSFFESRRCRHRRIGDGAVEGTFDAATGIRRGKTCGVVDAGDGGTLLPVKRQIGRHSLLAHLMRMNGPNPVGIAMEGLHFQLISAGRHAAECLIEV